MSRLPRLDASPRTGELARLARSLAVAADVELPACLVLLRSARDGDPVDARAGLSRDAAATDLVAALEAALTTGERRRGAHYTPPSVAERVAALALDGGCRRTVVDPACGGGALLLAAGRHLEAHGVDRATIARELLWGVELDPLAAAVTEAAIALWSGGTAPAPGHVLVGDSLALTSFGPPGGFDAVLANPPFQGQLSRATARSATDVRRLRERWGTAVTPYVDTAALFLLAAVDLTRPGGRVAMIQPQSTVAARDAAGVRTALARRARLRDLWAPDARLFDASVHVCVPVLDVLVGDGRPVDGSPGGDPAGNGRPGGDPAGNGPPGDGAAGDGAAGDGAAGDGFLVDGPSVWTDLLADARGTPVVDLTGGRDGSVTIAAVAEIVAGFRDEYYGLIPHVREAGTSPGGAPLVTSGLIDLGATAWGTRPARFAKRRWHRPAVDVAAVRASSPRLDGWLARVLRPKVVVATQTTVVEAAPDTVGHVVPSTPVVSVVPTDPGEVGRLTAVLCSPPVAAWVARRAVGTARSVGSLRISAPLLADVPLPPDGAAWEAATAALAAGDLDAFADAATDMYGLPDPVASEVRSWWHGRR